MRLLSALIAAVLLPTVLTGCGDDTSLVPGDTVEAREVQQFGAGAPDSIELPIGRLEVFFGDARRKLAARATLEGAAVTAPDGDVFLPLTWQYDAATFNKSAAFLGDTGTPTIDLLADGATYRLQPPPTQGEGAESFFVLVAGEPEQVSLRVGFAGVVQTLDLTTGEVDPGDASAIYLEPRTTGKDRPCDPATYEPGSATEVAQFVCTVTDAQRLAFAGGRWAPPGERWLVLTVTTTLVRYDVADTDTNVLTTYYGRSAATTFTLGGTDAVAVIPDRKQGACPDPNVRCTSVLNVVFPDPGKKRRLEGTQTVDLAVASTTDGSVPEQPVGQLRVRFGSTVR